jgi:hypothetical protein
MTETVLLIFVLGFVAAIVGYFIVALVLYWRDVRGGR